MQTATDFNSKLNVYLFNTLILFGLKNMYGEGLLLVNTNMHHIMYNAKKDSHMSAYYGSRCLKILSSEDSKTMSVIM